MYNYDVDIRYLQSFVTVVESGSFAEASRRLDLTPAAVAARIRSLEADLGVTVLRRIGRYVKPTEAGIKILDRSRSLLRDIRDLRAIAHDGVPVGELRIGVFNSALTSIMPQVLESLYDSYPDLAVFVLPGASVELCRLVAAGELDAAIVVEPQFAVAKNCRWTVLMEEPFVVVAHQSMRHRSAHELLSTEAFIRYDRTVWGGQLAEQYLRDHDLHPNQRLEINSLMAIANLIDRNLGVSLLPDWPPMWSSQLAISRIPLPNPPPVRRVGLVWDSRGPRSFIAKTLVETAQKLFAPSVSDSR
ncbi:LysR family transcriptional regulator [Paenalcaligenes niemegkensis]|uniref:LysR family transcriptional regulator n=1 Tax=Paenalcaligenes niemegkensis TaxID=2895469 RepID=UPI002151A10A|nr:LysR family transcriptional regulator [Paenalcaligenes niemegkensis]